MSDADVQRFVRSAEYMCSPGGHIGDFRRESILIQLQEAKEEWARRNRERRTDEEPTRRDKDREERREIRV